MDFVPSFKKPLGLKKRGVSELSVLRRSCAQIQQPDYPKISQEQKILDLSGRIYDFRLPLPIGLQVLDISDNIDIEPGFIFEYDIPTLQTLRINHCNLTELPLETPKIASTLRTFTLDGNMLTVIPDWVFKMPELNELSLYGNEIKSIKFPQNSHLIKVINLSFNPITKITTDENFNVQLLNLTQTKLTSIPDLFLPQLKTLYLSKCCIEGHLDYSICPDLSSLDISFNKIKSLSDNFVNSLKCLTNLNLSNNLLESLPDCFTCPPSLTKVSFSNNKLTTLPSAFMNSSTLENLNISNNKIEKLPPFKFRQLRYLNISNNQIPDLPDCFDISFFLTSLNVSFNKLTDLPHSMVSCRQILELNCTSNLFNHIPSVVFSFVTLKTLIFSGNTLTTVPDSLSALMNLTVFDLSNNNITAFPPFIQKMLELRVVSFSHNRISSVSNVTFPPKIQSIDLSFNIIENLTINPLTSLANLAIQYNRLKSVPNLADFPNLQFFSIACNNIEENFSLELYDTCSAEIEVFGNNDHINVSNKGKAHLTTISPSNHFSIGIASSLGTRQTMEDAFTITSTNNSDFFAIFDGHAGPNASRQLSDYIGDQIFKKVDVENIVSADEISSKIISTLVESNQYIKSLNIIDGSTAAGIFVTQLPSSSLNSNGNSKNNDNQTTELNNGDESTSTNDTSDVLHNSDNKSSNDDLSINNNQTDTDIKTSTNDQVHNESSNDTNNQANGDDQTNSDIQVNIIGQEPNESLTDNQTDANNESNKNTQASDIDQARSEVSTDNDNQTDSNDQNNTGNQISSVNQTTNEIPTDNDNQTDSNDQNKTENQISSVNQTTNESLTDNQTDANNESNKNTQASDIDQARSEVSTDNDNQTDSNDQNNTGNQISSVNQTTNEIPTDNDNQTDSSNQNNTEIQINNADQPINEVNITNDENQNSDNYSTASGENSYSDDSNENNDDSTKLVKMMYVFGIGDSRILNVSKNMENDIQLTEDQKPTNMDEYNRLKKAGFFISAEGRISRKLAVSRTMGDFWCHEEGLFIEPEIYKLTIDQENDIGVIIACDGLWDVISNEIAADVLRKAETASDAAISLKNLAIASGSQDNVSVIVIIWNPKKGDEGIAVRNTVAELPPYIEEQDTNEAPTVMTQLPVRNRRRR